jgi:chromatin segregation and condensation protein Rec8/ScpA/Scc1 (kleisin family)
MEGDDFPKNGAAEDDMDVPGAEPEDDEAIESAASNPEDKERQGNHFHTKEREDFGKGKRAKRTTTQGSFLATEIQRKRKRKKKRKETSVHIYI